MKKALLAVFGLAVTWNLLNAQERPVLVVSAFTLAPGVSTPYDVTQLHDSTVIELKSMLGKDFDVVSESRASAEGNVYTLDVKLTGWRPGDATKRMLLGLGSGRESADIEYQVTDASGKKVINREDTVRTNYLGAQYAPSAFTLFHPLAQKIAEHIKDAKLR